MFEKKIKNKHAATCISSLIVFHLDHKKSPIIAFVVFLLQGMNHSSLDGCHLKSSKNQNITSEKSLIELI